MLNISTIREKNFSRGIFKTVSNISDVIEKRSIVNALQGTKYASGT